ncbi:MAG: response regulator [Elusimicrobia bacterium]|nr:response regulator [Elusimicrobiota bacterium]
MSDDILRKLLVSFKAEHQDHLEKIRGILEDLAKSGKGPGPELEEAFRRAHSLKGAARAVDLHPIETLAHCVETIFSRVREGRLPLDKRTLKTIHVALDSIEDWVIAYFQKNAPAEPVQALDAVEALLGTEIKTRPVPRAAPAAEPAGPSAQAEDAVTVGVKSIEQLLKTSERVFSEANSQNAVARKISSVESQIRDLDAERDRMKRSRGRPLEQLAQTSQFSPVSRYLDFVDKQVRSLKKDLRDLHRIHSSGLWAIKSAGEQLRGEALQARMVPAESVLQGLRKMVRDLARDEGKEIEFAMEGLAVKADRLVLQALKDPLMHLLRNSVSHGIESPNDRRGGNKPAYGAIGLRLDAQGRLLRIAVSDDGRGVDWKVVADYAVKRRFLTQDEAEAASSDDLSRLLFLPGFSTARMVTELSGRGMGLSVVAEAVKRLQGRVDLRSKENSGASIEITVPISISTHRMAILESAGQAFAVPVTALERLLQVPAEKIGTVEGKSAITIGDRPVPVSPLAGLIGQGDLALKLEGDLVSVAVLKSAGGGLGVAVDAFVTEIEAIVKNLQGGAQAVKTFSGAILTGDGSPVLVLDPHEIVERFKSAKTGSIVRTEKAPPPKRAPAILVVDDSVTTRTLEKSILEAHGHQVMLAVDGEDALQKLRSETVDLAIIDIQMPRMDGFQLIERMKQDPRLSKLPVIIVTSLDSREEKERGLALGADAYIIKRKFDHKGLLEAIRQIL